MLTGTRPQEATPGTALSGGEQGRVRKCLHAARDAFHAGRWEAALTLLEQASRVARPGSKDAALALSNLLNVQYRHGAFRSALATARRLLEGPAEYARFHTQAYLTRGNTLWALGRRDEAAADFALAVAAAGDDGAAAARALLSWAKLAAEQGDVAGARRLLDRIPDPVPADLAVARAATGAEVAAAAGDYAGARRLLGTARDLAAGHTADANLEIDMAMLLYLEARCLAAAGAAGAARAAALLAARRFRRLNQGHLWEQAMALAARKT